MRVGWACTSASRDKCQGTAALCWLRATSAHWYALWSAHWLTRLVRQHVHVLLHLRVCLGRVLEKAQSYHERRRALTARAFRCRARCRSPQCIGACPPVLSTFAPAPLASLLDVPVRVRWSTASARTVSSNTTAHATRILGQGVMVHLIFRGHCDGVRRRALLATRHRVAGFITGSNWSQFHQVREQVFQ